MPRTAYHLGRLLAALERIGATETPRQLYVQASVNPAAMQAAIVGMALDVLETARFPRTTVQTPFEWPDDAWRENFMRVDVGNREELQRAGEERRAKQAARKAGAPA